MNTYKKSLLTSTTIAFLFAMLITFACKFSLNPLLLQQQQLLSQKFNLHKLPIITNQQALQSVIDEQLFTYIKVSNTQRLSPIIYDSKNLAPISYLLAVQATTVLSENGNQVIEFKAKNSKLLNFLENILSVMYGALLLITALSATIYYRLLKNIEINIAQEIANDGLTISPFSKVSAVLQQQKKKHQQTLQKQEKQISLLSDQARLDNLTGCYNPHAFRKELTAILSAEHEQQPAILFMIRASKLNTINTQCGFQQGDDYIINIAKMINKACRRLTSISIYRINGGDFALIARGMSISDAQCLAEDLKTQFDQYQALNNLGSIAYNGISSIISGQLPEQVLARTDMALAKAQTNGMNSWAFEQLDYGEFQFGQQHWQKIIEEIISKRALILLHQPIQAIHRNMQGYQEIFTRFIGDNNNMMATDSVFAMAQRVDMTVKLEQLILETLVNQCRHKTECNSRWGINITSSAMQNSNFIIWLERLLLREPNIAVSLIFEMREEVLDSNLIASKRIFDMLKRTGSQAAICKFGRGIGSFRLFKALKPDFVKIDASLVTNIERDSANQQFVRMIIDVAHRMDCSVIAEGIEHLAQKQILESMYVDGVQGFLIARPTPL